MGALKAMANCLIIEDSEVIRFVTQRIFKQLGHKGFEAETSEQGMSICQSEDIDCVFLDWDMPHLGALDFLQAAFAHGKFTGEIILCASENDPQQFALARAAGAKFHLLKPFDAMSINAVLQQAGIETGEAEIVAKEAVAKKA
jgi:two-component system, chemotaxis family, chemotaxis protein CheY